MNDLKIWLSASAAGDFLDVSPDTIHRRSVPWQDLPVRGRIRFKLLKLGEATSQERRYCKLDLEALLVAA